MGNSPTPKQLADKFASVLRGKLTDAKWADRLNAAMNEACREFGLPDIDSADYDQIELCNEAWEIASREHLGAKR